MLRAFALILLLNACASPAREFRNAPHKSMMVDGDEITVFFTESRAQAIRTNFRTRKQQVDSDKRFRYAIEKLTGCTMSGKTPRGDMTIVSADIVC